MDWMENRARGILGGVAADILRNGGRNKSCECPGSHSCAHSAYWLIGLMVRNGFTLRQARTAMLDSAHAGALWITAQESPADAFLDVWEKCTTTDQPYVTEPTEDEQRAQMLFLIEQWPGLGTAEIRKKIQRNNTEVQRTLGWLKDNGFVRAEAVGRGHKTPHNRTEKIFPPLDVARVEEHFRLWARCQNLFTNQEYRWITSHDEVVHGLAQHLVRNMLKGHTVVTRSTFQDIYGITDSFVSAIKDAEARQPLGHAVSLPEPLEELQPTEDTLDESEAVTEPWEPTANDADGEAAYWREKEIEREEEEEAPKMWGKDYWAEIEKKKMKEAEEAFLNDPTILDELMGR